MLRVERQHGDLAGESDTSASVVVILNKPAICVSDLGKPDEYRCIGQRLYMTILQSLDQESGRV